MINGWLGQESRGLSLARTSRMKHRKLFERLLAGHVHNVRFRDMLALAIAFGFQVRRISGSHHILQHRAIPVLLNLQNHKGKAKAYQITQFLGLIERYSLDMEERP